MGISTELLLIILCSFVVLSYFFSIASQYIKVPSVLLLLFAGIGLRILADANGFQLAIPGNIVQSLGVVGLIMIVLEAGLDLKLGKGKLPLIRRSFFTALLILVFSTVMIAALIYVWLKEDIVSCIVYAIPLSIMSSSIVLPSIHSLTEEKREFLVYEASFSDILGIMFFNYFIAGEILSPGSVGMFGLNLVIAIIASLIISLLLLLVLARTKLNVKFFLVFALLILIYSGGKLLHLPSLLIILAFGLMINNWELLPVKYFARSFPRHKVEPIREFMHSITAESSFLIRTFFFILFGYSIDVRLLQTSETIMVGSGIVIVLFVIRWLYLKYSFHTKVFPEVFFIPRGLITIVLFYKIPTNLKLSTFNDGILFFVILSTGIILSIGMILYKKPNDQVIEDPQFSERKDLL